LKLKASDEKRDFGVLKIKNTTPKSTQGSTSDEKRSFFSISKIRNTPLKEK
jgi:hypothetical protein